MSLFKRPRFSASGNPCRKRKNSGKELLLFLFLAFLADCCILFTITIKKTKCSTALSAPIFLPLLLCSRGVFPLGRFKNRRCIICAAKRISASIAVRNTTVPISVYSSYTAVTRPVRKRAFFRHRIVCFIFLRSISRKIINPS